MYETDSSRTLGDFDVRQFAKTAVGSRRDEFPGDVLAAQPLDVQTLRQLRFMMQIERYTMHHLRNLLVTPSHKDAYVTAFMTSWAFEKYWMADTLSAILEAHGVDKSDITGDSSPRHGVFQLVDRLIPIRNSVTANLIGEDFIAIHMSWGLLEERLAQIIYESLAEETALDCDVLRQLAVQKNRHVEFYASQAAGRLARSRKARRLTRAALRTSWLPTSFAAQPRAETARALRPVFTSPRAAEKVKGLDDAMMELPGLDGIPWARRALRRVGVAVPHSPATTSSGRP